MDRHVHRSQEIVSRPQPKAYVGVKYSVVQKTTDLRGEARLPLTTSKWLNGRAIVFGTIGCGFKSHFAITKQKTSPVISQKRLNAPPSGMEPPGSPQGQRCWYQSNAVKRLATSRRSEMSRVDYDDKSGWLYHPGAVGAVGIQRKGWETIIQLKPTWEGLILGPS